MEPLTADTVTDAQIRELRDEFESARIVGDSAYMEAFREQTTIATFGCRVPTGASERKLRDIDARRADADVNYHTTLRALGTSITWISCRNTSASERAEARARCAEIINARAARSEVLP